MVRCKHMRYCALHEKLKLRSLKLQMASQGPIRKRLSSAQKATNGWLTALKGPMPSPVLAEEEPCTPARRQAPGHGCTKPMTPPQTPQGRGSQGSDTHERGPTKARTTGVRSAPQGRTTSLPKPEWWLATCPGPTPMQVRTWVSIQRHPAGFATPTRAQWLGPAPLARGLGLARPQGRRFPGQ